MANTQAARLSFSVTDELGTEASIAEYVMVDPAMTVAQATTAWQAQATLLDPILDAKIQKGSVVLLTLMAGGKGAPAAGSRVEQTAVANFTNAITAHRFGIALAGLAEAVIVGGKIDLTEGGIFDLWADSVAPYVAGLITFTNTATQALVALADAFLSFRKRRVIDRTTRVIGP
jgi:hypothetical protein